MPEPSPPSSDNPEVNPATTTDTRSAMPSAELLPENARLIALRTKHAHLTSTLTTLQRHRSTLVSHAKLPSGLAIPSDWPEDQRLTQALKSANAVIKDHIAALHRYNEVKDIGLGLMGLVAERRDVRQAAVLEEFGMGEGD